MFSDGSFVYIPKNTKCPMDLSTYFRINNGDSGQFERTPDCGGRRQLGDFKKPPWEGCTAPMYDSNQLHAAIVELVALDDATINYSTVQKLVRWRLKPPPPPPPPPFTPPPPLPPPRAKGGYLQLCHQAGPLAPARIQVFPGPRWKRLRHHLEVPQLCAGG